MIETEPDRALIIALAGNPNAGKTTLFNGITRGRAKVANYPGVTVDSRQGDAQNASFIGALKTKAVLVDVPGCYALTARSAEESVAISTLVGRAGIGARPDVILNVVDATNLERNLYLTQHFLELGMPVAIALTMTDLMETPPDPSALSRALGVPVVIAPRHDQDFTALGEAVTAAYHAPASDYARRWDWPSAWSPDRVAQVRADLIATNRVNEQEADGWLTWLLSQQAEDAEGRDAITAIWGDGDDLIEVVTRFAEEVAADTDTATSAIIEARYAWLREHVSPHVGTGRDGRQASDRIDRVVTHAVFGPLLFLGVMALIFQFMFAWTVPLIDLIGAGMDALATQVTATLGPGLLTDLLTQGVIAGVGNVIVFLPQIIVLFVLIGLLEASGYLARAAYIMDRLMARVGLHGKAFVPMLTSLACAVPGIAATRTIENRQDRFVTILVAPLMTCSARLPVYALLIGALFPAEEKVFGVFSLGGTILTALYLAGIAAALLVAFVLKRTLFKGERQPLILELPAYHVPKPRDVLHGVRHQIWIFLRDAGTVILAATIVLWALMSFPQDHGVVAGMEADLAAHEVSLAPDADAATLAAWEAEETHIIVTANQALLEHTWAGRIGKTVQPALAPLGFDTKITIGLIAALSAREVMVSSLGVAYGVGEDVDDSSTSLRVAIQEDPNMSPAVGLALLVWFVLAFQCISTLAAVKRETESWRWPAFLVAYQTALAWSASFVVYRLALAFGLT